MPLISHRSHILCASILTICCVVAALLVWHARTPSAPTTVADVQASAAPAIDLNDPPESFGTFLHVQRTGGCRLTRAAALGWLDFHARQSRPLPANEANHLIDVLRLGGHEAWDPGFRQNLYNSVFNALHLCDVANDLTSLLLDLALHDEDRIMRLYALQHIGSQRAAGHLAGALADEVRSTLETFANDSDGDLSGTAITLLADWDGTDGDIPESIRGVAAATAANRSRPVDVRVSALHAAGFESLKVARAIATDATELVILRKAAIACIGKHGGQEDLTALNNLQSESPRIAQATTPARQSIQDRLSGRTRPDPIPYPSSSFR